MKLIERRWNTDTNISTVAVINVGAGSVPGNRVGCSALIGIEGIGYAQYLLCSHIQEVAASAGIHFHLNEFGSVCPVDFRECPCYHRAFPDIDIEHAERIRRCT